MADPKHKPPNNRRIPSAKKKSIISDTFVISRNATPLKAILDAAENQNLDSITAVPQYRSTVVPINLETSINEIEQNQSQSQLQVKEIVEDVKQNTAVPQYRSTAVLNNLIETQAETLEASSKEASPKSVQEIAEEIKQDTVVPQYRSTAVLQNHSISSETNLIPTNNFYKKPNAAVDKIDRNLSPAESKVLDHLIRLSIGFNKSTCQIRVSTLQERTGYRSDKTVREALNGLITKGLIVRQSHHNSPLGDHYQILINSSNNVIDSGNNAINSGNSRSEMLINSGSNSGNNLPQYSGSPVKNTAVLESKITGHLNTSKYNLDDDDFMTLLKDLFPNTDQEELHKTIKETHQLLAKELKERLQHSKNNPVSPNYIIECVRRLCSQPTSTSKKSRQKEQMQKIIDKVTHTNIGKNLSLSDFAEDVKRVCARDNVPFDTDLFNEIISSRKK